jgi:hypothetical protein
MHQWQQCLSSESVAGAARVSETRSAVRPEWCATIQWPSQTVGMRECVMNTDEHTPSQTTEPLKLNPKTSNVPCRYEAFGDYLEGDYKFGRICYWYHPNGNVRGDRRCLTKQGRVEKRFKLNQRRTWSSFTLAGAIDAS